MLVGFVDSKDADWIILSTPNDLHYEQTKYWLTQGKMYFVKTFKFNIQISKRVI